jgi:anti-sigma factor (TIGR02949 family)
MPANLRCEEALRLLAEHLDGELDPARHDDVTRHLETCRSCFSRAEFERQLRVRLARIGRRELKPAFAARMLVLMQEFAGHDRERPGG